MNNGKLRISRLCFIALQAVQKFYSDRSRSTKNPNFGYGICHGVIIGWNQAEDFSWFLGYSWWFFKAGHGEGALKKSSKSGQKLEVNEKKNPASAICIQPFFFRFRITYYSLLLS